jgi:hypothetical protein
VQENAAAWTPTRGSRGKERLTLAVVKWDDLGDVSSWRFGSRRPSTRFDSAERPRSDDAEQFARRALAVVKCPGGLAGVRDSGSERYLNCGARPDPRYLGETPRDAPAADKGGSGPTCMFAFRFGRAAGQVRFIAATRLRTTVAMREALSASFTSPSATTLPPPRNFANGWPSAARRRLGLAVYHAPRATRYPTATPTTTVRT